MMKKKKKKRNFDFEEGLRAKDAVREQMKTFRWRLALLMLGIFLVLTVIYYILLSRFVFWVTPVLYTAAAVLFLTFFFVNRGFSREPVSAEVLPESWSEERKQKFVEDDIERKALARKIMVVMVPVLLLVAVDILILTVLPQFTFKE